MSTSSTQCTGYGMINEIIIVIRTENAFWGFIPNPNSIIACNITVDMYGTVMYFNTLHGVLYPVFYMGRYMHISDVENSLKELLFYMPGLFREELETNDPVGTRRFDDGQRVEIVEGFMPYTSITYAVIDPNRFVPMQGPLQGLVAGTICPVIAVNTTTLNVVGNLIPITQVYLADALTTQNYFYEDEEMRDSPLMDVLKAAVRRIKPDLMNLCPSDVFSTLSIDNSETLYDILEKYFPLLTPSLIYHMNSKTGIVRFNAPLRNEDSRKNLCMLCSAMYNPIY